MLFNVTLKKDAPPEELERAKEEARKSGGTIKHEYTLIKGFTVEYPDDHIKVLESTEHLHVEQDGEVRTR
ncbi:hypothetical protein RJZ56_002968 [Blastomyces dermatitidis]|uniref:Inhibitor I9 domain-containing protein n=2 Tax=Ajellomyces dermatitidis TaxID=5039 RepID=F2TLA5_AJEDA|nr:uncharacterized protein BDCG_07569 [Blastomyces dermatitidis ER-3]EEQ92449.1 hypothetical protein BDCG_07569 [Blastomyces dermatitidis ER-3]EGE84018.1 hypothetical protein BDDG_06963 [Blastomyces dermatitidis ATCC 18188]EQL35154.1 hypothetical protein BDFG_03138 [Blastomyces dermatitidis ATCC 26199]